MYSLLFKITIYKHRKIHPDETHHQLSPNFDAVLIAREKLTFQPESRAFCALSRCFPRGETPTGRAA